MIGKWIITYAKLVAINLICQYQEIRDFEILNTMDVETFINDPTLTNAVALLWSHAAGT